MLSYAHGASHEPLLGETIGANLDRTIARVPDAEALVSSHQNIRYTYAELGEAVDRLAAGILAAGLSQGDASASGGPARPSGPSCSTPPPGSG
jgi:fatty-acyl-CoA synthase